MTDRLRTPTKLLGYVSEVGASASVDAQRRALASSELDLAEVLSEAAGDETLARPVLRRALWRIADGQATGLVVAELERLTNSVIDLGDLLEWFGAAGARFVALDVELDTARTPGRKMATALMKVSEWPRRTTSERTKAGLDAARAEGRRTGRPSTADRPEVVERIRELRAPPHELSLRQIAAQLNADGVPTARGAKEWRVSAVQRALGYERPKPAKPRRRRPELPPLSNDA